MEPETVVAELVDMNVFLCMEICTTISLDHECMSLYFLPTSCHSVRVLVFWISIV